MHRRIDPHSAGKLAPIAIAIGAHPLPARLLAASLLAAFLLSVPALSAAPPDAEILTLALRSPAERAGDYDALLKSWLEALPHFAESPHAEIFLRRLQTLRGYLKDEPALLPLAEKAMQSSYASGVVEQMLVDLVADLYRRAGREDDRLRVRSGRGFLLHWLVTGPFGKGKSSIFLRSFPPETEPKVDAVYRDDWQEIGWRSIARRVTDPLVNPAEFTYPHNGITYFLGQVRSDDALDAVLQRGSEDSLQVWLNGTRVVDDDPYDAQIENRRATGVRLAKGWNRILVKARSSFWLRLCDPTGHTFPAGKLTEEEAREIHAVENAPDPRWNGPFAVGALGPWTRWVAELESAAAKGGGEPPLVRADAHSGLAILYDAYGRDELAVEQTERALKLAPDDAMTLFHAGDILRQAKYLPPTIAKNRAQTSYDGARAKDPELLPAYERAAKSLEDDQKHAQAAAMVKDALDRNPTFLRGLLRLQSIYAKKDWKADEIEVLSEVAKIAPGSTVPALFWAEHYRRLNHPSEASKWLHKAGEIDRGNVRITQQIASIDLSRGLVKEAEEAYRSALRIEPDDRELRTSWIEFLSGQGKHDDALKEAQRLLAENPADPDAELRIAEVHAAAGHMDLAAQSIARARALDPGDLKARRALALLAPAAPPKSPQKSGDEFWAPYDEKLEDWILQVPTSGPLVDKAASITVLDIMVLRVERDGSTTEYVHEATKLLSEESKESLANAKTGGEIIALRTLTASGESLEPVAAEGTHNWVMPSLTPGAIVEIAYRDENADRHGEGLRAGSFFFQDMRFRQSFLLSRYVILMPEGLDAGFIESNVRADARERLGDVELAKVEKTVRDLDGGGKAIIYEARSAPRLEREQFMPSTDEYVPNVRIVEKSTWDDAAGDLRDRYAGSTLPTPELEDAARQVIAGIDEPVARARALFDFVQKTIPTEGRAGRAAAVLLEKSGNRNVLFKALLDIAGVPSRWAFLRPQEAMLPKTDWTYPGASFFPFPYVAIEPKGQPILYVSLSDRTTPFARLPEHLQGGKALILGPHDHKIEVLESGSPDDGATTIHATLQLGDALDVGCDLEFFSKSVSAYAQKEQLKTIPAFQKDVVLRQLANQMFPGAKVKSADIRGLDDPAQPFVIAASLTAPKLLKKSGEGYLLKPVFQPSQMVKSFSGRSKREHPFHFRAQRVQRDTVRVEGGEGFKLERAPADVTLASALGTYALSYKTDGNNVLVTREMTLLPGRLSASEFPAFVDFCEKVDGAERESIIFRKVE